MMTAKNERRTDSCCNASGKAAIVLFDDLTGESEVLHGEVTDVSPRGACLVVPKMLHVSTVGVVQMVLGTKTVVQGFEVRSARHDTERGTLIGIRFWREPPSDALDQVVRKLRAAVEGKAA